MNSALVLSAGHQLRDRAPALADATVACACQRHPALLVRQGPGGRVQLHHDVLAHVAALAGALDAGSPPLWLDHVAWAQQLLVHRGADEEELDHHLVCLAEALLAQLPSAVADGAGALVQAGLEALPELPDNPPPCIDPAQPLGVLAGRYLNTLLGGYRSAAARLLLESAAAGEPVQALCLQALQPALREIGRLWQTGRINVAQEHFFSAATQTVMAQLMAQAPPQPHDGRRVVVACVAGDRHELGARMVGDFLELAGWQCRLCGADTPTDALLDLLATQSADVLALSASMACHLHTLQAVLEALRADLRCASVRVLVGGAPFALDPGLWRRLGADGSAMDAAGAVAAAGPA